MSLAWLWRAIVTIGWLAFASTSGVAVAAEELPPLRVDPGLLGGAPLKPVTAPVPVSAPAPAKLAPLAQDVQDQSPQLTQTAVPRSTAEVTPVAPPPEARELPVAAAQKSPAPPVPVTAPARSIAEKPAPIATPAAAVPARPALAPATFPAVAPFATTMAGQIKTAQNLPPLRVDPALLGGTALADKKAPPVATETQPPEVAERPALPPLYSAHVAAGVFPHPATTAFSATDKTAAPTYVTARHITGVNEVEVIATGDAFLERAGDTLLADRIIYRQADDEVEAIGNVRLTAPDSVMTGPRMRMRMEESTGEFETPAYTIRKQPKPIKEAALTMSGLPATDEKGNVLVGTGRMILPPPVIGSGSAKHLEFRGEDVYNLENATYSTCAPGKRDWEVQADELELDYFSGRATGRNAIVKFMDVPILYTPWMNFSLSNERKSGFLTGSLGFTNKSSFEVSQPWYWNIAPHMDATITPRYMARRGLEVSTEFRYLLDTPQNQAIALTPTPTALTDRGQVNLSYLPNDTVDGRNRYAYGVTHAQTTAAYGHAFTGSLNLNGVSDSDYYSDLSTRIGSTSQVNLVRSAALAIGGPWYTAAISATTYQTLQNISQPYRALPSMSATAFRYDLPLGLALNMSAAYVNYDHPDYLLAKRTVLYPQLSLPLATAAFSLTPKISLHSAHYELDGLDRPAAAQWKNVPARQSSTIPIFSVDGSVVLERETEWFGDRSLVQTLEPRAFYVYIPKHDQSEIPVIDTGATGFNYAQMFSENRYAGSDRVGDANQLTLALTSRLIDPPTGAEILRATVGARQYFSDQDKNSSLPGETLRNYKSTDILTSFTGQVLPKVYADLGWQFNPSESLTKRFVIGGRYRPSAGRILNASYRFDRDYLEQVDVSGQWPLFGGWHAVGRYNYSISEKRVIETIGGLEYNAGCWVARVALQRLATIADQPTTAIFFQLELNDFWKVGSSPLNLLRRNVPGYGKIGQVTDDPVFVGQ
jgi:LPS-assembly protein